MAAITRKKLSVLMLDGESNIALEVARCLAKVSHIKLHVLSEDSWATPMAENTIGNAEIYSQENSL